MKPMNGRRCGLALGSIGILCFALLVGCQSGGKTEGQKQLDRLDSQLENLAQTLQESKQGLQDTIAAHDAVVMNQDGDLPAHFKKFTKGIKGCEASQKEVLETLEQIKATAAPYFAKWQQDLAVISDEDLRERSQERMEATQKRMEEMREQGEKAKVAYEPLLRTLNDHAAYLSNDLNVESASSLSKDSEKLHDNANDFYEVVDKAIATTAEYRKAIAMRTEPAPAAAPK